MPHAFDSKGRWVRIETQAEVRVIEQEHRQRVTRRGTTALFVIVIAALLSWGVWQAMVDIGNGTIQ